MVLKEMWKAVALQKIMQPELEKLYIGILVLS